MIYKWAIFNSYVKEPEGNLYNPYEIYNPYGIYDTWDFIHDIYI